MEKTLKRRMIDDMQVRGFSPRTRETYVMRVTMLIGCQEKSAGSNCEFRKADPIISDGR